MCVSLTSLIMKKTLIAPALILFTASFITVTLANEPDSYTLSDTTPSDKLFISTKIWEIHLGFSAESWEAMTPVALRESETEEVTGLSFGGFIAPAFMVEGDQDGNEELTEEEFEQLGKKWYTEWGEGNSKDLDRDQLGLGYGAAQERISGGKFNLKGAKGERNGIASVLGIEYPESTTDMEINDTPFESTSIRYKGNGTFMNAMDSQKFPFKIDLNDGYPDRELAGVVKLNLHNCITDPTYMNEVVAHQLFRDAGVPAPRTSYAKVFVSVPGNFDKEYFGLYSIVENVDKQFIEDRFGTRKGAILKPVTPRLFEDLGERWESYEQIYDPKTKLKDEEKWRLIDLCRLVSHASDYEFSSRIGDFFELDKVARYLAVTVLISDLDGILGPGQNFYLYLSPRDQKFSFISWDQDHSFGQWTRTQEQREKLSLTKPWDRENAFLERLFSVPEFMDSYLSHIKEINETLFRPERINAQVDRLAEVLRPAIRDDSPENFELFNSLVSMDSHHSYANILPKRKKGDPRPSPGSFGSDPEAKPIKGFVAARTVSVEDQLAGRSEGLDDGYRAEEQEPRNNRRVARLFLFAMDADGDELLSEEEFSKGFKIWFSEWKTENAEALTEKDIKQGLSRTISSMQMAQSN